ncbi:MAG TPA: hypothetical protein VG758_14630 [Hyphomicrobiaceae bacterium]|nr:hypothetical protein [Hyphomicrobiaceae bacterium]
MARKLLMLGCAAVALLMVSVASTPADAHRGRHHGGRSWGHHHHHHHFRHFHRHRGIYLGAPFLYGGYYYSGDCYWLRRRAVYTGSPYWWNRYYACLYGY